MSIENNQTDKVMYLSQSEKLAEIYDHYEDCPWDGRATPLDECACDCYERQVFMLGYKLHERQMYQSDPRKKV